MIREIKKQPAEPTGIGELIQARALIAHGLSLNTVNHEGYMQSCRAMFRQVERMYAAWLKNTGKAKTTMPDEIPESEAMPIAENPELPAGPAPAEDGKCPHGIEHGTECAECEMSGTPNDPPRET